jgi:hypothetical protein
MSTVQRRQEMVKLGFYLKVVIGGNGERALSRF